MIILHSARLALSLQNKMQKMKKILTFMIVWLAAMQVWGVQAYSVPVDVKQADGTTLTVVLHGDEDFNYYTTLDGVLLVQENGYYYVADIDETGEMAATVQLAHNADMRSTTEKDMIAKQKKDTFLNAGYEKAGKKRAKREPVKDDKSLFPHTGTPKAVVILAEFNDTIPYCHFTIQNPKRSFDDYFNKLGPLTDYGYGETSNLTGVRQYFKMASFDQFAPEFDVYGPVMVPSSMATYGGKAENGSGENMKLLIQDACYLMDDEIDFSQYDGNNDGMVDLLIIIYAGYSQSMGGNRAECIWPKSGTTSGGTYDGKRVSRYLVSAELNGFPNCWSKPPYERINGIGTLCHEMGHTLGLPDFYPTDNSKKGDNQGMEYWSLMDSGNYLNNGYAPVPFNAYEREAFGWMEIPTLTESCDLELKSIDDGGTAYRIRNDNDETNCEYYIIENIQNIGLNLLQRGHGMVVYHVDYDEYQFTTNNGVNNIKGHPRMTVVPADGLLFAQYNVGKTIDGKVIKNADFYAQLAGDPYPGTSGITALNDTMNIVNFEPYKKEVLNKAFDNIREENEIVSLTFTNNFQEYMGIEEISMPSRSGYDGRIYTIDGRLVNQDKNSLPKGIYIKGGKKIVKK